MAFGQLREITSGGKYDAYAAKTDGMMLALGFVFLVGWTLETVWIDAPSALAVAVNILNKLIWLAFVADFAARVVLSHSSWRFVLHHPLDLLAVVYPALRPLKILAVFTSGSRVLRGRGAFNATRAVGLSAVLLMWIGAVAILGAEGDADGSNIAGFGDALWWALVTTTTVGYGDFFPVTVTGRVIAGGLMLVGISLIGVVTASVAAWFVRLTTVESDEREEASVAKNEQEIRRLHEKIDVMQRDMSALLAHRDAKEDR